MARNEDVSNAIWDDLDGLSNGAMMLYLWSWTNPRCGMAGIYKCPKRQLANGRLTGKALDAAIEELRAAGHLFYEEGVVWVRGRIKRIKTKTPQIARSIANDIAGIPGGCPLRNALIETYQGVSWLTESLAEIPRQPITGRERYVSNKTRAVVLARDGGTCQHCGATADLTLDHIIPVSAGGSGEAENLQVLCRPCNTRKGPSRDRRSTLAAPSKISDNQAGSVTLS